MVECFTLKELYLKWNQLTQAGGKLIMEGVQARKTLAVLDLSWNRLNRLGVTVNEENPLLSGAEEGSTNFKHYKSMNAESNFFSVFAEVMEKQQSLVHVDLSWNRFNKEDSLLIAEAIRENHSMIGFHFDGNTGQIDEKQFL